MVASDRHKPALEIRLPPKFEARLTFDLIFEMPKRTEHGFPLNIIGIEISGERPSGNQERQTLAALRDQVFESDHNAVMFLASGQARPESIQEDLLVVFVGIVHLPLE